MISQRDAQDQVEVVVKRTCSAGETDCFKINWRLGGQEKNRTEGMGGPKSTLESIFVGLYFLRGSVTASSYTSRLSEVVTGLMSVLSTISNIVLRDCPP